MIDWDEDGFAIIVDDDPDYLAWCEQCERAGVPVPKYRTWLMHVRGRV